MDYRLEQLPAIQVAAGCHRQLASLIEAPAGSRILLVRGTSSLDHGPWPEAQRALATQWQLVEERIDHEPTVDDCEAACLRWQEQQIAAVIAIGGGSALDLGKALAGLLASGTSIWDHIEGFGRGLPFPGQRLPLIMLPTTAGTGSECTMNAVLGGEHEGIAFKKSLRHPCLLPDHALIDPELQIGCPAARTAACGMDASSQLMESFLSTQGSPITDALARSGLEAMAHFLRPAVAHGEDLAARAAVGHAAACSGICLAHAGLGPVHGFAPWLGSWHGIDHGVACGCLMASCNAVTLQALRAREADNPARLKYAWFGRTATGNDRLDQHEAEDAAIAFLEELTDSIGIPRLGELGLSEADCHKLAQADKLIRNSPIALNGSELLDILLRRL